MGSEVIVVQIGLILLMCWLASYGVPSLPDQIEDLPLSDNTSLSATQVMEHLGEGKVIPIFDSRYLSPQSQQALEKLMVQSGKKLCALRETPAMPSQFYLWLATLE